MDASFLTYEGMATDPVETHLNLEKPVYILGQHFKPDERKFFYLILSRIGIIFCNSSLLATTYSITLL